MKLHSLRCNSLRAALSCLPLGAALLGFAGCQSQAAHVHDHWTGYYVGPSMSRHFLSYDPETDGSYRDFQWRKKKDIELTIRRHFFGHNPENPFEAVDNSIYEPRKNHSLFPAPQRYIHVEGVAIGAVGLAGGGIFFPVPVDSIIATMEEGGGDEFMRGVDEVTRPIGEVTTSFLHDTLGVRRAEGSSPRED